MWSFQVRFRVNSESNLETPHVAIYENGHYFIGADNGIFSLMFDHLPEKIVDLTISQDTDRITFPTKDIFVKAACHIATCGVSRFDSELTLNRTWKLHM